MPEWQRGVACGASLPMLSLPHFTHSCLTADPVEPSSYQPLVAAGPRLPLNFAGVVADSAAWKRRVTVLFPSPVPRLQALVMAGAHAAGLR